MENKILVVDDDSGIGEMLKTLLEFYEYEVTVTAKPEETEKLILEKDIDLVLLDMLISGVNGTDVCARLRKNQETEDTPVLMMSALHDAGIKCKEAGANDFIAKPFEMEDLVAKIKSVLDQKDQNQ
jgi:DNA-binding response OmpR family regulator